MARRFRVKAGVHYERNPNAGGPHAADRDIKFVQDQVVESDRDLLKIYPNKFEEVLERPVINVSEERKQLVEEMLLAGGFPEEDRHFLEQLPEGDFSRVRRMAGIEDTPKPAAAAAAQEEAEPEQQPEKHSNLGTDVTRHFAKAQQAKLLVFKAANGKHWVTSLDAPGKPLNETGLSTGQVNDFVDRLSKEK